MLITVSLSLVCWCIPSTTLSTLNFIVYFICENDWPKGWGELRCFDHKFGHWSRTNGLSESEMWALQSHSVQSWTRNHRKLVIWMYMMRGCRPCVEFIVAWGACGLNFALVRATSGHQQLQISLLGSFKEIQRLIMRRIAFVIYSSGDNHRLADSNERKHSNQPTFLDALFWCFFMETIWPPMGGTALYLPIMADIFRMRMIERKCMRLFWVKLSKYSLNGDPIPVRIWLLKVDLTISGHHERHKGIGTLKYVPGSSLDPNSHGDMRHANRFGL